MSMLIQVLIYKDSNNLFDISQLVQKVVWSGRDGTPSRTVEVTLLDSPQFKRADIDVIKGFHCIFKYNNESLFKGLILKTSNSNKNIMTFKAADVGIRLSNNKDAFHYKKKKADEIFRDVCKRFGISSGSVCSCKKVIDEISKSTTPWDVIQTALQEEYKSTGIRHAVTCTDNKLNLIVRRENIVKWLLETDTNIISWNFSNSIEKVKTRIKLYSGKNEILATAKDAELENHIGIFQDINKPDEETTKKKSKLKSLANSLLKESKNPEQILNITALGLISMQTGRGAFVIIPDMKIKKSFYIVSDTHTFDREKYTMSLKLQKTTDLEY